MSVTSCAAPRLDWARAEDGAAIAALLAEPLPGALRLRLGERAERCAPRSESEERHQAVVVRGADGHVLGHGARTVRRLWLGGKVQWLGYLHGLRRSVTLTGDGRRLSRALATLVRSRQVDEVDYDFTAILRDNVRARRVLEGGLPGAPTYHHLTDYRTAIVAASVARRWSWPAIVVCRCPISAIAEAQSVVDSQASEYAMVARIATDPESWWTAWRGERLVGVVRRVDRQTERHEAVAGYALWLATLRPLLNLGLLTLRRPTLPAAETDLALIYAACLSVPDYDRDVIRALLGAVSAAGSCDRVAWGLGAHHPLRSLLDQLPAWRIDSRLYTVGACSTKVAPTSNRPISPEAAWL